jgi:hypothetical protein
MATKKRPAPKSKKPVRKASAPAPSKKKAKAAPAKGNKAKPVKATKATKTKSSAAAKKPSNNGANAKPKTPAPKKQPSYESNEPLEQSGASVDLVKLAKEASLKRLLRN